MLEVLYCYECGDVSLGGFVIGRRGQDSLLAPTRSTRASAVDRSSCAPPPAMRGIAPAWSTLASLTEASVTMAFAAARWDPAVGLLEVPAVGPATGVVLVRSGQGIDDRVPALPTRCPSCGFDAPQRSADDFRSGRVRSPIRAHTSGLAAATQLYLSQLVRSLAAGEVGRDAIVDAKTIVFTDSRDDAARTAAGVARNHHRDLVRQVLRREVNRAPDPEAVLDAMDPAEAAAAGFGLAKLALMAELVGQPLTPEARAGIGRGRWRVGDPARGPPSSGIRPGDDRPRGPGLESGRDQPVESVSRGFP